jgi:hypothetical protein
MSKQYVKEAEEKENPIPLLDEIEKLYEQQRQYFGE